MNEKIKTILVAPDKFKGTMTAAEAAHCIAEVLRSYGSDAVEMPMADGGEGTAEMVSRMLGLAEYDARRSLYRSADGCVGAIDSGRFTYGDVRTRQTLMGEDTGALGAAICDILSEYPRMQTLYIGIGGTGTCDGGDGMLRVIVERCMAERVRQCVIGLSDVQVPLLAEVGEPSALMFAPQKGALAEDMPVLTARLRMSRERWGAGRSSVFDGAGGGIGFAIATALGARCLSGAEFVQRSIPWERGFDMVVSGEGCIDAQTDQGKVVGTLRHECALRHIPFVAFGGRVEIDAPWAIACSDDKEIPSSECALEQLRRTVANWYHRYISR